MSNETTSPAQESPPTVDPTNVTVAARIGLTSTGVSRIRVGGRFPSPRVMALIDKEYDWPLSDQFAFRIKEDRAGYGAKFRQVVFGEKPE